MELIFLTTHFINESVVVEYNKLKEYNKRTVLVLDNEILRFKSNRITKLHFFDSTIDTLLFDNILHKQLGLPFYTIDNRSLQWYNCDYRYYYVKHFYPGFDYYWQFEGDIYSTFLKYDIFFNKFNGNKCDILAPWLRKESEDSNWEWKKQIDWIYKNCNIYGCIFAVSRLSTSAIDFLYNKRLDLTKIFENSTDCNKSWLNCEIFAPTELMNNGYSCKRIDEPYIWSSPGWDLEECKKKVNFLYHPVKSSF